MLPPRELGLKIKIGSADCDRLGDDATPWVNLNGTLLLFSAESMSDNCQPNDSNAHDLFAVPLAKDGTPTRSAIPLSALNNAGSASDETDPSLAPDSCSIYFASDSGTGNYDLYRAARKLRRDGYLLSAGRDGHQVGAGSRTYSVPIAVT